MPNANPSSMDKSINISNRSRPNSISGNSASSTVKRLRNPRGPSINRNEVVSRLNTSKPDKHK